MVSGQKHGEVQPGSKQFLAKSWENAKICTVFTGGLSKILKNSAGTVNLSVREVIS
jgi:hypothetical protein